jgi:putative flippase GtrA
MGFDHRAMSSVAHLPGAVGAVGPVAVVHEEPAPAPPVVDVVVPVYNGERVLATSIERLHEFLRTQLPFSWRITIVDNASTDATWTRAQVLAGVLPNVVARRVERRGRGLALRTAWSASDAAVLAYTDVDLSTGLDALLPLCAPLVSGHSDLAIGSRLANGASVARGPRREAISRAYNLVLRTVFAARFRDAQCGFKAVRADVAARLLPEIEDDAWFFDTELLLLAEHNGLRIHEVPVTWTDDPDARVAVASTAVADLRGCWRVAGRFLAGRGRIDLGGATRSPLADDMGRQLVSFAAIGSVSTAVSLALFLWTRGTFGAVGANAFALTATALANTRANRRWTFARRGPSRRLLDYRGGALAYVGGLALSSGALGLVARRHGGLTVQVLALAAAWSITTVARFALLRGVARDTR